MTNKKFILALIFSGLLIPGLGQLYLGQKKKGLFILLLLTVTLLVFAIYVNTGLLELIKQYETPADALKDITTLAHELYLQKKSTFQFIFGGMGLVWLIAVGDLIVNRQITTKENS